MLKLVNCVIMLLILYGGFQSINGEFLQCGFKDDNYFGISYYSCFVTALENPNDNKILTGHSGNHQPNKYDKNVEQIYISELDTKFIPEGLGSLFNLTGLIIRVSKLIKIRSRDFQGMQNLEYLCLMGNSLSSVPSDAFSTLPRLKVIDMMSNQIEYIRSEVFDQLTNLNVVALEGNICVFQNYVEATQINQMKDYINVNCIEPNNVFDGEKLKCEFKEFKSNYVGTLYSCYVSSLDNSFNNMTIDGYTGTHQVNKNEKDVKAILIRNTTTINIPANLGSVFNLTALVIRVSKLIQIRSRDFQKMQNLEYLSFSSNKLTSVPSDAFSTLTKLKIIILRNNQITEIPSGLFTNNLNLEYVDLEANQIEYIGSGAFDQLTNLNRVNLVGNICVKKYYKGATAITRMKKDIKKKCKNPNKVPATTTTTKTTTTQSPLEIEFEALKNKAFEEQKKNEIELNKLRDDLKMEKLKNTKIRNEKDTLPTNLFNCEANQQKSIELNLTCDFKMTNDQYICETRDLTIHHKDMILNEVIGTHLKSKSNQEVTELIIVKSSMSYWSNDIFTKLSALQTLRIQNAQLIEFKRGDFSSAFKLTVLVVNGNKIETLGDDVFRGTEDHLTEINLNSNKIEEISTGTFHGLKQLKVLSLKDNLIMEIPLETFMDIVMLEILILTGNKIKFLDGKMLQFNNRLMTLAVDQNELREVDEEILDFSVMLKDVNLKYNDCIDESTGTNNDDTDGRTINDISFVIRNCCKNPAKGLNAYHCG